MNKSIYLSLLAALSMTACASINHPTALSNGQYIIAIHTSAGLKSSEGLLQQSIQEANAFCAAKNADAKVIHTLVTGTEMFTPQDNQVIFECVPKPYHFTPIEPSTVVQDEPVLEVDKQAETAKTIDAEKATEQEPEEQKSLWEKLKTAVQSLGQ